MIKQVSQYEGFNITFQVTEDCNLRCKYCYEVDKRPGDLPLDYAKKFIDLILTDEDPIMVTGTDMEWILKCGLILDFIGGDALMRPKLCDDIISYFMFKSISLGHKWATRWRASTITNGTLFDAPGVKDFLYKYKENLSFAVSIDGCPEIHNLNRVGKDGKGSMDKILEHWDWFKEYIQPQDLTTKSTLNLQSIPYLYKSVKFMHEDLGISHINMNFVFEDMKPGEDDLAELDRQLEKVVDYTLQHQNDMYIGLLDISLLGRRPMDDIKLAEMPKKTWCGAGAMPCLVINGKIYPCFRFAPNTMSTRNYDFYVGDIWNGFSHKERFLTVRSQTRDKISPSKCIGCNVDSHCAWCIGGAYAERGEFFRQTYICDLIRLQHKWSDIYWKEYRRQNRVVDKDLPR